MIGSIYEVTPPAAEPITLADAKEHLRVSHSADDDYITALTITARRWCEGLTRRQLVQATLEYTLDGFPARGEIEIPRPPLVSVTSIKYTDTDGSEATWSSSLYTVDARSTPGRIYPAYGQTYPQTRAEPNAVRILFVAGYSETPADLVHAMKTVIGHWYQHRSAVQAGTQFHDVPKTAEYLAKPLAVRRFG